MNRHLLTAAGAAALLSLIAPGRARSGPAPAPIIGRWDLTVHGERSDYPSWLEVTDAGGQLAGRFVGQADSARPVKQVTVKDGALVVIVAPQYEGRQSDLRFEGHLVNDRLEGRTADGRGHEMKRDGRRGPA